MFDCILENIIQTAQKGAETNPGDYQQDGLLFCGECLTPKQHRIQTPSGKHRIVPCMCVCASARYDQEREDEKKRRAREEIERLRASGIRLALRGCTFRQADPQKNKPQLDLARRYAEHFSEMQENNTGLLFYGNPGNGKTFTAACIANALVEQGVPVLMTTFPAIIQTANDLEADERLSYFRSLNRYDLLVVDDLGVERKTDFGYEIVFSVIDQRYISGKPMIATTNLTKQELDSPSDPRYKRVYDRVLEMSVPVEFSGESLRPEKAKQKRESMKKLLYGK